MEADVSAIAGTPVVAGAAHGSTVVLAGCDPVSAAPLPLWVAVDDLDFALADRPSGLPCVRQVEATAFGWYASGTQGGPLWSQDGTSWEVVDLASSLGLEFPGQLGFLQAVFVAPDSERVTLLFSRAAEAESTIATLLTTTDGSTWAEGPEASARLFDSSTIAEVIEGGDGLLAVGSSPGGEFVPTAAVFTSLDGLEWRRVTPEQDDQDYDDKVINDVMRVGDLYIAVGGDFFTTGLMTAWWSSDGITWTRAPHPDETTDPSVAQMTAEAITVADGFVWASGRDFDARRGDPQTVPALWRSRSGQEWERVDLAELEINVPFELTSTPDVRIGVWPPPFSVIDEPLVLFGSD